MGLNSNFTPAALEAPSPYLDTAIMEMMKKIMEAVTHLMKSFKKKIKCYITLYFSQLWNSEIYKSKSTVKFYILYDNCSHHERPEEAFKPLIEFGGVSK